MIKKIASVTASYIYNRYPPDAEDTRKFWGVSIAATVVTIAFREWTEKGMYHPDAQWLVFLLCGISVILLLSATKVMFDRVLVHVRFGQRATPESAWGYLNYLGLMVLFASVACILHGSFDGLLHGIGWIEPFAKAAIKILFWLPATGSAIIILASIT